ncbi:MAG: LysE family transporter [bacterium]|nr:MAG: LysE family transporter [bacterium]
MLDEHLISVGWAASSLLLTSAVIGFAAAVPLGPVGVLAIQRALSLGFWRAFLPTLGAVFADALLGAAAALGSGLLTSVITGSSFWLKMLGSALLLAVGAKMVVRRREERSVPRDGFGVWHLAALNFTLMLSNPLTLAFFLAAFAFLGVDPGRPVLTGSCVIGAGIALGTVLWFALICATAGIFHRKVGPAFLRRVQLTAGMLLLLVGLLSATSVLMAG